MQVFVEQVYREFPSLAKYSGGPDRLPQVFAVADIEVAPCCRLSEIDPPCRNWLSHFHPSQTVVRYVFSDDAMGQLKSA